MIDHPPDTPPPETAITAAPNASPDRSAAAQLFRNARREALVVVIAWVAALTWTVAYCYLRGYRHDPDSWAVQSGLAVARTTDNLQTFLGFPDWMVFGIVVPWVLATAFTIGFCLFAMTDDDLGTEAAEGAGHGH